MIPARAPIRTARFRRSPAQKPFNWLGLPRVHLFWYYMNRTHCEPAVTVCREGNTRNARSESNFGAKRKLSSLVHQDRTYVLYFFIYDDLFGSSVKMRWVFLISSLQQTEFGISKLPRNYLVLDDKYWKKRVLWVIVTDNRTSSLISSLILQPNFKSLSKTPSSFSSITPAGA